MQEHQEGFEQIKAYLSAPLVMAPPSHGKPIKLYISASETTIGSMLTQDNESGVQKVVYYLNRTLTDTKTRYNSIEKLCLALYFSYTKLKYYLIPCEVFVISQVNIINICFLLQYYIIKSKNRCWLLQSFHSILSVPMWLRGMCWSIS